MEIWVPVYGFPNYEVSDAGRVRRMAHVAQHSRYGERKLPERMLNPKRNGDGYWRVKIGGKLRFVHVLVLESFVSPRPSGMQACHNNGKPDDNRLGNLRWDTPRNNVQDRRKHGTYQNGENNHQFGKFKHDEEVRSLIVNTNLPAKYLSEKLNIPLSTVYGIRKNSKGRYVLRVEDIS